MVGELIASLIIAVVQGLTEWLPVSSSGHIALFEKLLGFNGGLLFEVALHFGTLMAVFVYFGGDIVDIIREVLSGRVKEGNGKLGLMIIVATIPAAIFGFLLKDVFESVFTNLWIAALGFAVTGVFLLIASVAPVRKGKLSYGKSLLIGCAQIISLFPGVSRSGTTIGAGLLTGLSEKEAIKFSFLMSIPIIFGANILVIGNTALPSSLIWATMVAFIVGLITIHLLYGYVLTKRENLKWFALYTFLLAIGIVVWQLVGGGN